MKDPPRLLDDPGTHDLLRAGLEAGRAELPTADQLDSLAAKLGPLIGPGGGGGPPIDVSVPMKITTGLAAKALGGLALVTAGVTAAVLLNPISSPPVETPRSAPPPTEPSPPEPVPIPTGVEIPEDLAEDPLVEAAPDRPRPRPRPSYEVDPSAELALIRRAQEALRSSPGRALELTAEHERRFGPGTLAQEREVVAIDALSQQGRLGPARARAERFRHAWPRSAHLRRIDVILGSE